MKNKTVFVCNRNVLYSLIPPHPDFVLISIESPDQIYENIIPLEGWLDSIQLRFHDTLEEQVLPDGNKTTQFGSQHASTLLDFILKNSENNFIIHCNAGISRSVGVGVFIHETLGHQLELFNVGSDAFRNILVVNTLRHELRGRNTNV